ncbi:MAG: phenylacetate--CoA ligase family protein [Dehalococcoidia bacterium]|nr:phenylacetate--CoA ligase family protein [Dehalococcoidia bacterium]
MNTHTSQPIQPIAPPSTEELSALRSTMLHCRRYFPSYRRIFHDAGITHHHIESDDPLEVLRSLPVIGVDELHRISMESVGGIDTIVDTETSSGTTSGGKIRFISYEDDATEHRFLAGLLRTCGIGPDDRVACLDTDPAAVMISFPRACELVPTAESYCVSTGAGFERSLQLLSRLEPTALVSVPSIIERILDASRESRSPIPDSIRRVIYIGEGMDAALRRRVQVALGAEVFSYYGSSETSALGIECAAHAGIHLFGSRTLFEVERGGNAPDHGELIVTTLVQRALPLLRYRLGDLVRLRPGACVCGLDDPRIDVLGRSEMFASILGSKIHHHSIHESLVRAGLSGPLQIVLKNEQVSEQMRLRVADRNSHIEGRLLSALLADHQDVEFLHDSGLLDIRMEFRPVTDLLQDRKANRITDLR